MPTTGQSHIQGLHHSAYRCRDSEETRAFYEDFLGLPFAMALRLSETKTGRPLECLHSFFQMDDGSFIAFFEVPESPYDFQEWHDFDLHLALTVEHDHLLAMHKKGVDAGMAVRGVTDHGIFDSIYFRDPNGYVVELTAPKPNYPEALKQARPQAHQILSDWQATKPRA